MCELCGKRKAAIALFLSEHGPQLGIRRDRALLAWSDLNAIAIEMTKLPEGPQEVLHASHEEMSKRAAAIFASLSLAELEEIHFASAILELTGQLHGNESSRAIRAKWRAGERDPDLLPDAVASIEQAVAQEDFNKRLQKGIEDALTQVFEKKGSAPGVTVFVPGNGKPVPPA